MTEPFEQEERHLRDWIADLISPDCATRLNAGEVIHMRQCCHPRGFTDTIRSAVDDPSFRAEGILPLLLDAYRKHEPELGKCKLFKLAFKDGPDRERRWFRAIELVLLNAGSRAGVITAALIEIIMREPDSDVARCAAGVLAGIGPTAKRATDALLLGLAESDENWTPDEPYNRALVAVSEGQPDLVGRLLEMTRNSRDTARRAALATLQALGVNARSAVPDLLLITEQADDFTAQCALRALQTIMGNDNRAEIARLLTLLGRCQADLRPTVVETLRVLGVADDVIAGHLGSGSERALPEPTGAPAGGGETSTAQWENFLGGKSDRSVDKIDASERSLPILILGLASEAKNVRSMAGDILMRMWGGEIPISGCIAIPPPELVQARFAAAVRDVLADPRFSTTGVLEKLIARHGAALHDYHAIIRRRRFIPSRHEALSSVGLMSGVILENCGVAGRAMLPQLRKMLKTDTPDHMLGNSAAKTLAGMGSAAKPSLDDLIDCLLRQGLCQWPNPVIDAIVEIAGGDAHTIERLVQIIESGADDQRPTACAALRAFGTAAASAVPALLNALHHPTANVREWAARALGTVAPRESPVTAELLQRTHDTDGDARMAAADALGEFAARDDGVVDRLIEMTADGEWYVRGRALAALGRIGMRADQVVPIAIRMLDDWEGHDWSPAECAVEALRGFGAEAAPAVAKLIERLDDERFRMMEVIDTLGAIGPAAAPALSKLRILYSYPDLDHDRIERAIRRIEGESRES